VPAEQNWGSKQHFKRGLVWVRARRKGGGHGKEAILGSILWNLSPA